MPGLNRFVREPNGRVRPWTEADDPHRARVKASPTVVPLQLTGNPVVRCPDCGRLTQADLFVFYAGDGAPRWICCWARRRREGTLDPTKLDPSTYSVIQAPDVVGTMQAARRNRRARLDR